MFKKLSRERGQGLVEYALILVLVAIVVIGVLLILGPAIGNVFREIKDSLLAGGGGGGGSIITGVSASRNLSGTLTVTVSVSESTTVTLSGDASGSGSCSSTCTFTRSGAPLHGSVTASASDGSSASASW